MSDRKVRVESLIRELAASFIMGEANTSPMITVTHVDASPDYSNATIYVTTMPDGKEADALIFLKRNGRALRQLIKKKTNLKVIPNIDFAIDYGERHRQSIDELANNMKGEKLD